MWLEDGRSGPSSLLGFQSCGKDTHNDGNDSEALSKDASPHQHLGLSGLPLLESAEAIHQSPCSSQTAWRRWKTQTMTKGNFFIQDKIELMRAEDASEARLTETKQIKIHLTLKS